MIARAIAIKPKLKLFDEPISALDPELVGEVLSAMRDLANQGLSMIAVTQEIGLAHEAADRVIFADGGHIVEQGKPEDVPGEPAASAHAKPPGALYLADAPSICALSVPRLRGAATPLCSMIEIFDDTRQCLCPHF